jgi:hypothetical protein
VRFDRDAEVLDDVPVGERRRVDQNGFIVEQDAGADLSGDHRRHSAPFDLAYHARWSLVIVEVVDVTPGPHSAVEDGDGTVPNAEQIATVADEVVDRLDLAHHLRLLVEQVEVMHCALGIHSGQMQRGLGELVRAGDLSVPVAGRLLRRRRGG